MWKAFSILPNLDIYLNFLAISPEKIVYFEIPIRKLLDKIADTIL